jgi:GTP cyclohydrolase II
MGTAQTGTLWRIVSTRMPTKWGVFDAIGFERDVSNGTRRAETAFAIARGALMEDVLLLHIHSPCNARASFDAGAEVDARIPSEAPPNPHSFAYLRAKREKLGHTQTLHMECPA